MSQKRRRESDDSANEESPIFRSKPVEDRDSTFIALFSPDVKPKDLQNLPEIKSASHKILAWRKESNQQSITGATKFSTGSDDDGEKYGGKKVEKVLNAMQVSGACVVARWYGGTLLGPVRFEHIENCAREAARVWQESVRENRAKKARVQQDERDRARLERVLGERDASIEVLRKMAVEKEEKVKQIKEGGKSHGQEGDRNVVTVDASPAKPAMNYGVLSVDRLRAFEKARDATLSFLLKRIDKAEAELKSLDTAPEPD